MLVRTGLGRKALQDGLPDYVRPVAVYDDLAAAVDAHPTGHQATANPPAALLGGHD